MLLADGPLILLRRRADFAAGLAGVRLREDEGRRCLEDRQGCGQCGGQRRRGGGGEFGQLEGVGLEELPTNMPSFACT